MSPRCCSPGRRRRRRRVERRERRVPGSESEADRLRLVEIPVQRPAEGIAQVLAGLLVSDRPVKVGSTCPTKARSFSTPSNARAAAHARANRGDSLQHLVNPRPGLDDPLENGLRVAPSRAARVRVPQPVRLPLGQEIRGLQQRVVLIDGKPQVGLQRRPGRPAVPSVRGWSSPPDRAAPGRGSTSAAASSLPLLTIEEVRVDVRIAGQVGVDWAEDHVAHQVADVPRTMVDCPHDRLGHLRPASCQWLISAVT